MTTIIELAIASNNTIDFTVVGTSTSSYNSSLLQSIYIVAKAYTLGSLEDIYSYKEFVEANKENVDKYLNGDVERINIDCAKVCEYHIRLSNLPNI